MGNSMAVLKHFKESKFKPNSIIMITGASSGIGEEMAYQYAVRKVRLFLCARSADKLEKIAQKCRDLGSECEYQQCDVTKEQDCKSAAEKCIERYGGIDLLVVNAGVNAHIRFEDVKDMSVYEKLMQTNFFGYLYPTKYAFEALKKNKGQILVISSASGEVGMPMRTAYCASKFAVTGFFESLRIETKNSGVDITIICPPSVETKMRDHAIVQSKNSDAHDEKRIPVSDCVNNILIAADRKARKVFFPASIYMGTYVRPFLPWIIDDLISKNTKL